MLLDYMSYETPAEERKQPLEVEMENGWLTTQFEDMEAIVESRPLPDGWEIFVSLGDEEKTIKLTNLDKVRIHALHREAVHMLENNPKAQMVAKSYLDIVVNKIEQLAKN